MKPEAWDRWLAGAPKGQNIEDRRDLDAIDIDNIRWRRAHEPKKPLVQFPLANPVPLWLRANEEQWLKTKK